MSHQLVRTIQRDCPQIYFACHVSHVRTKSNRFHLSSHDSSVLAHLHRLRPATVGALAKHLGVGNSTVSAAVKRLSSRGYVTRTPDRRDRRKIELKITGAGTEAVTGATILDPRRVTQVLARLTVSQQKAAVRGLSLLARAAAEYQATAPKRTRW